MAIGFIVVNWALIEQQLDFLVNIAYRRCNGKPLEKSGVVPKMLKRKLQFLHKAFTGLPLLAPFSAEGLKFIPRARALSPHRDNLVHGSLETMKHTRGVYKFAIVKHEKDGHSVKRFTFGPADFLKIEKPTGDLATEMIAFSQRLGKAFPE